MSYKYNKTDSETIKINKDQHLVPMETIEVQGNNTEFFFINFVVAVCELKNSFFKTY